jgi:4-hydroxythreonine-4-phosphate dehydrogenase
LKKHPRILITPGEPAGIGPDILIQLSQEVWPAELVAVCDPALLVERAKLLNLPLQLEEINLEDLIDASPSGPQQLKVIPVKLLSPCTPGILNKDNALYVVECLKIAADYCLQQKAAAMVTGPVQKSIINAAGIPFSGHTEFLAERCHVPHSIMLFVTDKMKVALATTHIPLSKVAEHITENLLLTTLQLLHSELQKKFFIANPTILVAGLNPHAGEHGHLGREEIEVMTPALNKLRSAGIQAIGPLPADTIFTEKYLAQADAILAMYHDQALPIVKYQGFSNAVNFTLGLPIIRTSVDHGTALDLAGTLKANPDSLKAALNLAIEMTSPQ